MTKVYNIKQNCSIDKFVDAGIIRLRVWGIVATYFVKLLRETKHNAVRILRETIAMVSIEYIIV